MIYEHFRATGAQESALDLTNLFTVFFYKAMTFRISMQSGNKLYYLQVK